MKFRDPKTGEVFEDIDTAIWNKCRRRDPCDTNCPLFKLRKHIACRDYVISHPAETAHLMGLEVITGEEEPVDKKDKPRICQVLGVEVGEVFTADTPYGRFQRCVIDEEGQILNTGTNVLCYMLNHPDRIIRKPRFTEEEVAALRALYKAGAKYVVRERVLNRWLTAKPEWRESMGMFTVPNGVSYQTGELPDGMFPSLRPGQAVRLEEVVM